jgi:small subunit ribosomal protein S9
MAKKRIKRIKKAKKAEKPKKVKEKIAHARGKRKRSIARATVRSGKGVVRINKKAVDAFTNRYEREMMKEPLRIAGDIAKTVDVYVNVMGGGRTGQAQASRSAIARALVEYTKDEELKKKLLESDRFLLFEDPRKVEPKKYKGRKARARFQKSYR